MPRRDDDTTTPALADTHAAQGSQNGAHEPEPPDLSEHIKYGATGHKPDPLEPVDDRRLCDPLDPEPADLAEHIAREIESQRVGCPIHAIPDCSPLLNGCDRPRLILATVKACAAIARDTAPPPEPADDDRKRRAAAWRLAISEGHATPYARRIVDPDLGRDE